MNVSRIKWQCETVALAVVNSLQALARGLTLFLHARLSGPRDNIICTLAMSNQFS